MAFPPEMMGGAPPQMPPPEMPPSEELGEIYADEEIPAYIKEEYKNPATREIDVKKVKLTEEKRTELVDYLTDELETAKADREGLEAKWQTWVVQYDGRMMETERPKEATWRASLDYNITREKGQHARSRIVNNIITQDPIYVAKSRKPLYRETAQSTEEFLDFALDQFDFEGMIDKWIENAMIYSYGVIYMPWVIEEEIIQSYELESEYIEDPNSGDMVYMPKVKQTEKEEVVFEGVKPEVIFTEDFYFPYKATNIQKSPWVALKIRYSEDEIKRLVKKKVFAKDLLDVIEEKDAEAEANVTRDDRDEAIGVYPTDYCFYTLYEFYVSYDVNGDGKNEEIIVTLDPESGKIARCIYNYYHNYKRPFLIWQWERRLNSLYGVSLCQILEPVHRAISSSMCQRLDCATIANSLNLAVPPSSSLAKKFSNKELPIAQVMEIDDTESIKPISIGQPFSQLPELEQMLMQHADKLVGITDYMQGMETISRPTASGQQLLVEEGKQPLYAKLTSLRSVLADFAYALLSRYRQFFPEGIPFYVETPGGQMIQKTLELPPEMLDDKVLVEIKASSSSLNKGVRKQEILGLLDRMSGAYQMMMQMMQGIMAPPPVGPMTGAILDAYQKLLDLVLVEFDLADNKEINPPLKALQQAIQQMQQQMMQQMQQQMMGGGQQGGPPQGGPPQGGPPQGGPPQGGM